MTERMNSVMMTADDATLPLVRRDWSRIIRDIVNGDVDSLYMEAGAAAYLADLVEKTPPASDIDQEVNEALERTFASWEPRRESDPDRLLRAFDLIQGFRPNSAWRCLAATLSVAAPLGIRLPMTILSGNNIHTIALMTLGSYFPVPPLTTTAAYRTYLRILSLHLSELNLNAYAAPALWRLLSLNAITFYGSHLQEQISDVPDLESVITFRPDLAGVALNFLLESPKEAIRSIIRDLLALTAMCDDNPRALDALNVALKASGREAEITSLILEPNSRLIRINEFVIRNEEFSRDQREFAGRIPIPDEIREVPPTRSVWNSSQRVVEGVLRSPLNGGFQKP